MSNPTESYKTKTAAFYDANVIPYKDQTIGLQEVDWIKKFTTYLPSNGKTLDVGCGYGRDCKFFSSQSFQSYGIDISSKMVETAKEFDPKSEFQVMDMMSLTFNSEFFDGIWCNAALLHLKKDDAIVALNEFKRVLKTGGVLFLSLKAGEGEKFVADDRYDNAQRFFSYYSQPEIENLLNRADFNIIDINYRQNPSDSYSRADKICIIAQKRIEK